MADDSIKKLKNKVYTVNQAKEILGLTEQAVTKWIRTEEKKGNFVEDIDFMIVGKSYLILKTHVCNKSKK
jgi:predicted transcriptional regulator